MEKEFPRGSYEHCLTLSDTALALECERLSGTMFRSTIGDQVLANVSRVLYNRGFLILNPETGQYEKSKDKQWPGNKE